MEHTVFFPGLGLEFTLNPVALTLFGHNIYWYGVIIAVGFLLAVAYCYRKAPQFGVDSETLIDMLFFAVPLGIIGARAYYVIFYPSLYHNADGSLDWGEIVAIWDGGLAIYGGIIAAVLTVIVFCKVRKLRLWSFLDVGCYGLLIGQAVGRWGNFVNEEAYGGLTDLPWRMCSESIANTLWNKGLLESEATYQAILDGTLGVHPTFFYESLWNVIGLILLIVISKKWRRCDGQMFLSYVIWYGIGRAIIEGMRTDSLYFFGTGIRTSQMLAILSAVVAAVLLIWRQKTAGPASPALAGTNQSDQETEHKEEETHGSHSD